MLKNCFYLATLIYLFSSCESDVRVNGKEQAAEELPAEIIEEEALPFVVQGFSFEEKTFGLGEVISISIKLPEVGIVKDSPSLNLTIGSATIPANYVEGTGTDTLVFQTDALAEDLVDLDGIVMQDDVSWMESITSESGDPLLNEFEKPDLSKVLVDSSVAPQILEVILPEQKIYRVGEKISIQLKLSENVLVSDTPSFKGSLGDSNLTFSYSSGSESDTLLFESQAIEEGMNSFKGFVLDDNLTDGDKIKDSIGVLLKNELPKVDASSYTITTPWKFHFGQNTITQYADKFSHTVDIDSYEACTKVAVDSSGNMYLGCFTDDSLGDDLGGGYDAFVAKINKNGGLEWIKQYGANFARDGVTVNTAATESIFGVLVDKDDFIYVGLSTGGALGEANAGGEDLVFIKYDPDGNIIWLTQFGADTKVYPSGENNGRDICRSFTFDHEGNLLAGCETSGNFAGTKGGSYDLVLLNLDPKTGAVNWGKQFGAGNAGLNSTAGNENINAITVDKDGNIYLAAQTKGALVEPAAGGYDAVLIKLDKNREVLWSKQYGQNTKMYTGVNTGHDFFDYIAVSDDGYIYVGGASNADFLGLGYGGGYYDPLLAKFSVDGDFVWANKLQTSSLYSSPNYGNLEYLNSLAVVNNKLYFSMYYGGDFLGKGIATDDYKSMLGSVDENGSVDWMTDFATDLSGSNVCYGATFVEDHSIYCGLYSNNAFGDIFGGGSSDFTAVKVVP